MLPKYKDIHKPLLYELALREGCSRPRGLREGKTIYETLAEHFDLSEVDLEIRTNELTPGNDRSKWNSMVRWARRKLVDQGMIDKSRHGIWKLTDKGWRESGYNR